MYVPEHFKEDRLPVLHEAMQKIGFATLVTLGADGIEATHLPMLIEPDPQPFGTLCGHMARANPQWQRVDAGIEALAMFLGPNCYVTPSWYPEKQDTGKVVPTWNYLAVHAYGPITFFHDPDETRAHLGKLTAAHESMRSAPWAVTDGPADYIDRMVAGVVAFRLRIARLEGKWKMSQNRPERDQAGVRAGLAEGGAIEHAVAEIMHGTPKPDRT
jgi:transcriptional regulator